MMQIQSLSECYVNTSVHLQIVNGQSSLYWYLGIRCLLFGIRYSLASHITNIVPDQIILDQAVQKQNKIIVIQKRPWSFNL